MTYVYSPLPIHSYRLVGLQADEVSVIMETGVFAPLWNLFWLSNPSLDLIPKHGSRWWTVYRPNANAISSLIRDSYNDSTLCCKVTEHPFSFAMWFELQEHRDYVSYEHMGGRVWVNTILQRADEAGTRITATSPPVQIMNGKMKFSISS